MLERTKGQHWNNKLIRQRANSTHNTTQGSRTQQCQSQYIIQINMLARLRDDLKFEPVLYNL